MSIRTRWRKASLGAAALGQLTSTAFWRSSTVRRWLGLGLVLACVEVVYVFIVSAGRPGDWYTYMAYFDLLAEGFRSGHLYMAATPAPELIAAANPFDPQLSRYWLGDSSYYRGHFYLYFGPVPAMLLAGIKVVFRIDRTIGDQYLVFGFFSLAAFSGALIIERLTTVFLSARPLLLVALSMMAFAVAGPILHLMASSSVYQASIAGGQGFLCLATAIGVRLATGEHCGNTRRAHWQMAACGAAFALAIGCRLTLMPSICLLMVALASWTAWQARELAGQKSPRAPLWPRFLRNMVWLGTPVAVGCLGLLLYNRLRFDAWFDFGHSKQLTTWPVRLSLRYLAANVFTYALRPFQFSCQFPYAIVPYTLPLEQAFPRWLPLAEGYIAPEPVAGLFMTAPCVWTIPLALASTVWRPRWLSRSYAWVAVIFALMGTVTGYAPLIFYLTTMRYLADMSFGLTMLGLMGMWTLFEWSRQTRRAVVRALGSVVCVALCVGTIVMGLLLGYQGYTGHVERVNPALHARLSKSLSVCK